MKPIERLMLFRRGFRDGAGGLAYRHPENADYMAGYQRGSVDAGVAAAEFARAVGHDTSRDILRAGRAPSDGCEWNPVARRAAFEHEEHFLSVRAEVLIGMDGHYRVCSACAALPEFRRFKKRPIAIRAAQSAHGPPRAHASCLDCEATFTDADPPEAELCRACAAQLPCVVCGQTGECGCELAEGSVKP